MIWGTNRGAILTARTGFATRDSLWQKARGSSLLRPCARDRAARVTPSRRGDRGHGRWRRNRSAARRTAIERHPTTPRERAGSLGRAADRVPDDRVALARGRL